MVRSIVMTAEDNDRLVRWQKLVIEQLGYTLNLVFALTIAALGYVFVLLKDISFPAPEARWVVLLALILLTVSVFASFGCILNRLSDFRGTAQRVRGKPDAPPKEELRELGRLTWCLFYISLIAFVGGVTALGVALLETYGSKLSGG